MYEYKTELLDSRVKWGFNDSADETDIAKLDEFLNRKAKDGWELVTYSYMTNAFGFKSVFAITFKRKVVKE